MLRDRCAMWATVGIAVAYALTMALVFQLGGGSSRVEESLIMGCLFTGPMMIACVLSLLMNGAQARRVIIGFQIGYIFATVLIFWSTFSGEHEAQYQLALLFIPVVGFIGVVTAGAIATWVR